LRGLDDEHAFRSSSAAPSLELLEQLQRLFVCAEILQPKHCVGRYNGGQTQVAEVESLGQHLGTDEDVYFPVCKVLDDLGFLAPVLGSVAVQTCNCRFREQAGSFFLDLLGAGTQRPEGFPALCA
jgi:hypothetical protein